MNLISGKNIATLIISVCFSLIIMEVGLRLFTVFPIHTLSANRIHDERLGYRLNPSLKDVDSNGFRNKKVPEKVDIAALGDSHTFGVNVRFEDAWPKQLGRMIHKSVYNFGVGGYGILQYSSLMEEAMKLKPEHVILALYLANDLNDIYKYINKISFWQEWVTTRGYTVGTRDEPETLIQRNKFLSILSILKKTAIGSCIAYYSKEALAIMRVRKISEKEILTGDDVVIGDNKNNTIIKYERIARHERYMDINQSDIALSFEIMKDLIHEAKIKADSADIQFSIVFIPSKEYVFFDYLKKKGYQLSEDYLRLVDNERSLVENCSSFFEEIGIKFCDTRSYVEQELYKSGNVYPVSDNGHPRKIGYTAYAQAVYENLFADNHTIQN